MKGILKKDWYVLWKAGKATILFVLAYSVLFTAALSAAYLNVICILLVVSLVKLVMAYEEKEKWDHFAISLPVRKADLVKEKYVLGALLSAAGSVLSLAGQAVGTLIRGGRLPGEGRYWLLCFGGYFLLGILILALEMPALFKFGVNKGRIWFMMLAMTAGGIGGAAVSMTGMAWKEGILSGGGLLGAGFLGAILVTAAACWLSVRLAVRFYAGREF